MQFDEVLLASRRMQLAPQGVEVQVVRCVCVCVCVCVCAYISNVCVCVCVQISREKLVEAVGGGEVGAGEEASRRYAFSLVSASAKFYFSFVRAIPYVYLVPERSFGGKKRIVDRRCPHS